MLIMTWPAPSSYTLLKLMNSTPCSPNHPLAMVSDPTQIPDIQELPWDPKGILLCGIVLSNQ